MSLFLVLSNSEESLRRILLWFQRGFQCSVCVRDEMLKCADWWCCLEQTRLSAGREVSHFVSPTPSFECVCSDLWRSKLHNLASMSLQKAFFPLNVRLPNESNNSSWSERLDSIISLWSYFPATSFNNSLKVFFSTTTLLYWGKGWYLMKGLTIMLTQKICSPSGSTVPGSFHLR